MNCEPRTVNSKILVLIISCLLLMAGSNAAAQSKAKDFKAKRGGPIRITSDRLDAYNEQKLAVFSGNVVAVEADRVMKSNQLYIYYKKESKKEDKPKAESKLDSGAGDLDRIEAKGNVRITQGERIITGEEAVFLNDDQKIIVTGNPVMREGGNTIRGDKIIVLLEEDRGFVESSSQSRVTAVIYPEDKDKVKGKK